MEVNLELKPIQWSDFQGSLYCEKEWVLLYSISDSYHVGRWEAKSELTDCTELCKKHHIKTKFESFIPDEELFDSREDAIKACEAHHRELMLKAFLQPV